MLKQILLIAVFSFSISAQDFEIKSLKTYPSKNETEPPVIIPGQKLTIEFDIQADHLPDLIILFKFCDRNWQPYNNLFLANQNYNTEYNLWFETLPATIEGARYHYIDEFPNKNVTFPFYGKWKYYITDFQDTSVVFESGRFIVVNPVVPLNVKLKKARLEGRTVDPASFGQIFKITTSFDLPADYLDYYVRNVEIIENQKFDYPVIIEKDQFGEYRFFEGDGLNEFNYIVKDIQPGNEYRQTDIRNKDRFPYPSVSAQYDGIEVSRLFDYGGRDLNGGSRLLNFKNEYADYLDVTFELRLPDDPYYDVFVVGSFTGWKVLPQYVMTESRGIYSTTISLKRGQYDYQYVTGEVYNGTVESIDWLAIEGNDWRTDNEYHIFLYYENQKYGTYDEIIGYKKIRSGR